MSQLKKSVELETAFDSYTLSELIGQGGAGRVYGGLDSSGMHVAVKILSSNDREKRKRFKNEIGFLFRNKHKNIVTVSDFGMSGEGYPFYAMPRYKGSLRNFMRNGLPPDQALALFSQILDGVEAFHYLGVVHRDIKPENILLDGLQGNLAISDFGIAHFEEEFLMTSIDTQPTTRLANFQYAAPEQRISGTKATASTDIYALGLILNEMFTTQVPHGTDFKAISAVSSRHAYLDPLVGEMIRQDPGSRPQTIHDIKSKIASYNAAAINFQKLQSLERIVVKEDELFDSLSEHPPRIVNASWDDGVLRMELDQPVNGEWIHALRNMGSYSSIWGLGPDTYRIGKNIVEVSAESRQAQQVIDQFKNWLPQVTQIYKNNLKQKVKIAARSRQERLDRERIALQTKMEVNQNLRF